MADLSNDPHPSYNSSTPAAGVLAALIGISLISWFVQSIQARFKPWRPCVLLFVSHLTIFIHLVLRATLSTETHNSRAAFTAMSALYAIGLRVIILANYDFLTQVRELKPWLSRTITIGSIVAAVGSGILTIPAGSLSYNSDTVARSFQLRQVSAGIILGLTVLFYPIWFSTKTVKFMTKQAIILLIISSIACLIINVYSAITSAPKYYVKSSKRELWFYIFQLTPLAIAQFTWNILHPKRSIKSLCGEKEEPRTNFSNNL